MTDADKKQARIEIIALYQQAVRVYRKAMMQTIWKAKQDFYEQRERLQAKKVAALAALEKEGKLP